MKNAVTIFFPNGQQTEYVMGINDVDVISHDENCTHVHIIYKGGKIVRFHNLPFMLIGEPTNEQ